jgi:hypothetical protein
MNMQLDSLFQKSIDRQIEGVIKADDVASLKTEVDEYILTNEIATRMDEFLHAYNNYEDANGAWISGFFGSGKSHLLKMLALLLENREIDGKPVLQSFLDKCGDDAMLAADLKTAAAIPSRSILFNIDQKSDIISKEQIDALLSVFVKVFDEMCGYYGKQGHIAKLERDLDQRGRLETFKNAYARISGKPWDEGREMAILEADHIDAAYCEAEGKEPHAVSNIVDKYRSEYRVSIEDFADQVKAYIDQQVPGFRLNFFADEVGQYIAESQKLRTNLQTIAESLATKCRGQAWLIVTAQEDMTSFFGDRPGQETDDYSKIQARFKYRMKLTSRDVAEVIQKRLLMKTEESIPRLSKLYDAQVNNFKTLFDFADGAQTYRNYRDREHFIQAYPFIPYQFDLFQASIQNLSLHNAFEGKHSSVGERSMLGVFQQVAVGIRECEVGDLAPFHLMFEGIRTALKARIQQAILNAEHNLENELAIKVLKALFLVKYIKSFRPTIRNLCVLMLDSFDADLPALRSAIEEAVNLLEQQTYIQRNGELYEFLTNEEKDVEEEIKNTDVDITELQKELVEGIFDGVLKTNKIRFADNKQDYPFTRKLDGQYFGRQHELAIHVITPFHPDRSDDDGTILAQSMGQNELLVLMPADDRLMTDVMMLKRTEKYIRQNSTTSQSESVRRILDVKRLQNDKRKAQVQSQIENLLQQAELLIGGRTQETRATQPAERISDGFQQLIRRTYSNLRMLGSASFSESAVDEIIQRKGDPLLSSAETLGEAEQEILNTISRNKTKGVRPTLQSLVEEFERKPYGWPQAATLCCIAKLYAASKIELRADANILEGERVAKALLNSRERTNTFAEPQSVFRDSQIRALKDFYSAFFDKPPQPSEARSLADETKGALKTLIADLEVYRDKQPRYPFLSVLDQALSTLKPILGKPYAYYLEELESFKDELLHVKEEVLDPVRTFMNGQQVNLYDEAQDFLQAERTNLEELGSEDPGKLEAILADPYCYKGDGMRRAKILVNSLREAVLEQLDCERNKAMEEIQQLREKLLNAPEFSKLPEDRQKTLQEKFDTLERKISETPVAAVVRDQVARFRDIAYPKLFQSLVSSVAQGKEGETKSVEYVPKRKLETEFDRPWLATKEDVEAYLASLRKAYLKAIQEGKRIQL